MVVANQSRETQEEGFRNYCDFIAEFEEIIFPLKKKKGNNQNRVYSVALKRNVWIPKPWKVIFVVSNMEKAEASRCSHGPHCGNTEYECVGNDREESLL